MGWKTETFGFLVAGLAATMGGCSSPRSDLIYGHPGSLYLLAHPCGRLVLEVAHTDDVSVPKDQIEAAVAFLRKHCDKPGGIDVVYSDPIPVENTKGFYLTWAAEHFAKGPQANSGAAYMLLLFHNSDSVSVFPDDVFDPGKWNGIFGRRGFVDIGYPCAAYIDVNGGLCTRAILHEIGHLLGLYLSPLMGHCSNPSCLMYRSDTSRLNLLVWEDIVKHRGTRLCLSCRRHIRSIKASENGDRLRFNGPMLVRQEDGYFVVSLPSQRWVMPGSSDACPSRDKFATYLDANKADYRKSPVLHIAGVPGDAQQIAPEVVLEGFSKACSDVDPAIRAVAQAMGGKLTDAATQPAEVPR